jgi:endonuclease YncB( thermonuclease family)
MAQAIEQLRTGLRIGHAKLGAFGAGVGTPKQQVHDGDTITAQAIGNLGVRFLGVDAPEVSFQIRGREGFIALSNPAWEVILSDPFAPELPDFDPPIDSGLRAHLRRRLGPGAGTNHAEHAEAAHRELERQVEADLLALEQPKERFEFFLAFGAEVMDRYGRLLGYINRHQPDPEVPTPRPRTYNERLLEAGMVSPYFIWPNVNPFRASESVIAAAEKLAPGHAKDVAEGEPTLRRTRQWVRDARERKIGLYAEPDPLVVQPFEVRFLGRRQPPDRWVVDIGRNDPWIIPPQRYYRVRNVEDRLYIPAEFVPLFLENGWQPLPGTGGTVGEGVSRLPGARSL